jgi:hypothetical protein
MPWHHTSGIWSGKRRHQIDATTPPTAGDRVSLPHTLVDYRDQLVRARTQQATCTHAELVNILAGYERPVPNVRALHAQRRAQTLKLNL